MQLGKVRPLEATARKILAETRFVAGIEIEHERTLMASSPRSQRVSMMTSGSDRKALGLP